MTSHLIDGVDVLLWPHPTGLSAFAAPFVFDLEYDDRGRATIDAYRTPLNVKDYPSSVDRYRALDGPACARILKAALAGRDDYRDLSGAWEQYLVRLDHPGIDEAAFLRIVVAAIRAWRRSRNKVQRRT